MLVSSSMAAQSRNGSGRSRRISLCQAAGSAMFRYGFNRRTDARAFFLRATISGVASGLKRACDAMPCASSSTISNTRAGPGLTHPGRGSAIVTLPSAAISASAVNVVMTKAYPIPPAWATPIPPNAARENVCGSGVGWSGCYRTKGKLAEAAGNRLARTAGDQTGYLARGVFLSLLKLEPVVVSGIHISKRPADFVSPFLCVHKFDLPDFGNPGR